ncbi:MAG: hypothetical protein WC713_00915 [Candidatus Methylomirabilota bacterium]|jgi:hypothetical protein
MTPSAINTDLDQYTNEAQHGSIEWERRAREFELDRKPTHFVWAKVIAYGMRQFYEAS